MCSFQALNFLTKGDICKPLGVLVHHPTLKMVITQFLTDQYQCKKTVVARSFVLLGVYPGSQPFCIKLLFLLLFSLPFFFVAEGVLRVGHDSPTDKQINNNSNNDNNNGTLFSHDNV